MTFYQRISNTYQLEQVLQLQQKNLVAKLDSHEQRVEGFVTVRPRIELLEKMNCACPHIIATDVDTVVGYALVMLPSFRNEIPLLKSMFEAADRLLAGSNYEAMGQICIENAYRGRGLFRGMYQFCKNELQHSFDGVLTEFAT